MEYMQILLFFAKCARGARELDIELNSRIKEKLMNHLNLINGLLVKKTQEMGRKKLTNRVKNSLNVEENSGMV